MIYISSPACMLKGNCTNITRGVNIKNSVLIQVFGFDYMGVTELYIQGIRVLKVADFHGL